MSEEPELTDITEEVDGLIKARTSSSEVELDYARYLRLSSPVMEQAWVHLVRRGPDVRPAQSLSADECHIDLDAEGNVMGVYVAWDIRAFRDSQIYVEDRQRAMDAGDAAAEVQEVR